jgi:glucan-binding YG repeat protein
MTSFAAPGWAQEDGTWVYNDRDNYRVTDSWKKSGNDWFYLDDDGYMATSKVIETNDEYYYVNSLGARVTNEWREIDSDHEDEDSPDTYWYYFGNTGKAYKAPGSGKTSLKSIQKANGEWKKYAFDNEGRMLFGWVSDSSERVLGDDAWKEGIYYCGESSDGAAQLGSWALLDADDDDNELDNYDGSYWFYFGTNGKKTMDTTKTINGRKYRFRDDGATIYDWYTLGTPSTATPSTAGSDDLYYNLPTECWLAKGWFKTVPGAELDQEAYDNGDEYWFYADGKGQLTTSKIRSINNHRYAFNEKGEMLYGLYALTFDDSRNILTYDEIESESELPKKDDAVEVYYFGDSPKEGVMATGKTTVDLDGEKFTFNFRKSGSNRGAGYNAIFEDGIYVQGRLLKADRDMKYEVVSYDGNDYLINTSGKLAKNKKNIKDSDGMYYVTDKSGIVIDSGYDKLK